MSGNGFGIFSKYLVAACFCWKGVVSSIVTLTFQCFFVRLAAIAYGQTLIDEGFFNLCVHCVMSSIGSHILIASIGT